MGHIIKEIAENDGESDVEKQTTLEFMCTLYKYRGLDEGDSFVFQKIGIQKASPPQQKCLIDLPLTATYSCLELFFHWIDEGFYDFSTLPFPFKAHLSKEDMIAINKLNIKWDSTDSELMKELQQLIDVLKHSEQDIVTRVNEAFEVYTLDL